jgi:pimeloyl-ACP methyl ester carboxylesterase
LANLNTAKSRSVYIEQGSVRLHATDYGGAGKPICLLVHGAIAHGHWWDGIIPELRDLVRPVTVDLRGHGDSEWADDYSYRAFTSDLDAWIRWATEESGEPPGVIAHSFGGVTAIKLHEDFSPEIRFIVPVDVPLEVGDRILGPMRLIADRPERPWGSKELFIEKFRLVPEGGTVEPEMMDHIARYSVRENGNGTWVLKADKSFHRDREGTSLRASWENVKAPAMLIIGGASDRLFSEDIDWLRENRPDVRLETIPDAHHHVFLDSPETFILLTRDFLSHALSK